MLSQWCVPQNLCRQKCCRRHHDSTVDVGESSSLEYSSIANKPPAPQHAEAHNSFGKGVFRNSGSSFIRTDPKPEHAWDGHTDKPTDLRQSVLGKSAEQRCFTDPDGGTPLPKA